MPTLRQLEYLVAVSDLKHFGRAAASVNVSQPTLSQQIKSLEQKLEVKLIERGETPVRLTPIGREIVDRARKAMMQVDDLTALARRSGSGLAGTIRFGITPTLGPYLMPAIIAQLHRDYPDMRLYIREGIPDEQINEIRRGALDMMLSPLPISGSDLHIEPLFREPLHMVCAPDHTLCGKLDVQLDDFQDEPVLSIDKRHHFHRQVAAICDELGAQLLKDYEGTSLDSLRQMAGSGLGLAILPELYLRSEAGGADMVKQLDIIGWSAHRSIAAVWREGVAYADSYELIAQRIMQKAHDMLGGT